MTAPDPHYSGVERRHDEERRLFDQTRADLKRRLGTVCTTMAPVDLDELVTTMTRLRFKYQLRCAVFEV